MDTTKLSFGNILYFEDGKIILIGPPSGDHNDWALKYSTIEITKDEHNCQSYVEFYNIEDLLSYYSGSGKRLKSVNINNFV